MKRRIFLLLSLLALSTPLPAQSVLQQAQPQLVTGAVPRVISAELRQQTFELVWRTVKDKHFDPQFGGVNWEQARARYAPKVNAAPGDAEFYGLLQEMLGELRQSHFAIIPPEATLEEETAAQKAGGEIGIAVKLIGTQLFITRVQENSAAARNGLRAGLVIRQIDQTSIAQLAQKLERSTESAAIKRLRLERLALARVNGAPGAYVRLTYLDTRNLPREANVQRERVTGEYSPAFGNFPPQRMEFEAKRLASGVAYIRFNIFVTPMMEKMRAAIRAMRDAPGMIFDLRGNPGGLGGMAAGIAGHLFTQPTSLGRMRMRAGYTNFAVFPQQLVYRGPVAILLDGGSASTSEVFASGMQELGRALIVGERSAGAALPSVMQKLPTGALFQYAIGDFKTPKGTLIEGRGVVPDLEIKPTRAALLSGRDLALAAAVAALQKRAQAAGK